MSLRLRRCLTPATILKVTQLATNAKPKIAIAINRNTMACRREPAGSLPTILVRRDGWRPASPLTVAQANQLVAGRFPGRATDTEVLRVCAARPWESKSAERTNRN